MRNNLQTERDITKLENRAYRRAAARLSGGSVGEEVAVNRPADREAGAFIEVIVWVPRAEMEKEVDDPSLFASLKGR